MSGLTTPEHVHDVVIEFLPSKPRLFTLQVPGHPAYLYRGAREIIQLRVTSDTLANLLDRFACEDIPHVVHYQQRVRLRMRTPQCPSCPLYHQSFDEGCSLHWGIPLPEDVIEAYKVCEDPAKPLESSVTFYPP